MFRRTLMQELDGREKVCQALLHGTLRWSTLARPSSEADGHPDHVLPARARPPSTRRASSCCETEHKSLEAVRTRSGPDRADEGSAVALALELLEYGVLLWRLDRMRPRPADLRDRVGCG